MAASCILVFLSVFLFRFSHSANVTINGASEWKYSTLRVRIGDSVLFKHKYHYGLYIFRNEKAFNACDFHQAFLLSKPDAIYRWNPSRTGFFFFSFKNSSLSSSNGCEKLAILVVAASEQSSEAPPPMAAPGPVPGGVVASSPAFPWPFQPRQTASPPTSISPETSSSVPAPSMVSSDNGVGKGKGTAFIYSNPAVPLPSGEVDSETIQPSLPTSSHKAKVMVGLPAIAVALLCGVILFF